MNKKLWIIIGIVAVLLAGGVILLYVFRPVSEEQYCQDHFFSKPMTTQAFSEKDLEDFNKHHCVNFVRR